MKSCSEVPPGVSTECTGSSTDELLTDIGHELRSPLTSILAFADALHDEVFGPLNEGQKQALLSIRECVQRQTAQIADVIDLRRLEAGISPLNPVPCRLSEAVDHAMSKGRELVRSRRVRLTTEIMPEDLEVHMDAKRLGQMVTHLLNAGVLAADVEGVVRFSVDGTAGLSLQVVVAPPGCEPVPPEPGPSDAAVEKRLRKLGPVGLALLQTILAQHGGTLVCQESAEGCICLSASLPCPP